MTLSPHPNTSYHLAYITALPSELTAAITLLDDLHGIPQFQPPEDTNAYILGAIGTQNIVMCAVLVGIGGGVSGYSRDRENERGEDIRLGDVVVGVPTGRYGGIVQYDCEGQLNSAPEKLLGCVTMVNCLMRSGWGQYRRRNLLAGILEELGEDYAYPVGVRDRLFCSGFYHGSGGGGCLACGEGDEDASGEIYRERRESTLPVVHVGTIASGNTVIGDGVTRDRICERYKGSVLCFEMEAAGLANCLPCLVVRGISDYADVHKNDEWRPRAIAAAVSYAKALILHIPPDEAPRQPEVVVAADLVREIRGELAQVKGMLETGLSSINYSLWDLQAGSRKELDSFLLHDRMRKSSLGILLYDIPYEKDALWVHGVWQGIILHKGRDRIYSKSQREEAGVSRHLMGG
ncbi:hypothetical protein ASPCADRAFT_507485 [Aspergillus carbonarius ITEM 5010]|uniref:Nucleoside phosphorylase domain-containing protein n=1 Tax=Aspergillus carbonarius (strain ITEM 5010) TaxID=602072 RepID=A0A1R3RJ85_ASPC5|nr:hypothetical protein ASPCADRAFT_507485 [Aspergillus carbonarius ITEM 5010]